LVSSVVMSLRSFPPKIFLFEFSPFVFNSTEALF
jgi:hypothetical protein